MARWVSVGGAALTADEVREVLMDLACLASPLLLANEMGVSERSVRRWMKEGIDGAPAAFLRLAQRLHLAHMPWEAAAVPIRVRGGALQIGKPGELV